MKYQDKGTVLVVDDEPANLGVLFAQLEHARFKVLIAQDGSSALRRVERLVPDIILLDVRLPDIDGFELCRRLKAKKELGQVPVIFLSALTGTADKLHGLGLDAVDYISKPFEAQEVVARVERHLTIRNLQKQLEKRNAQLEQEIAERVRAQEALRQRMAQLEALREVGLEIAAQLDLDALLHSIVVRATELLEGDTGYVVLYRPERDVMELVVTTGDAPIPADMTYPREHGLAGKIWETGKAMIVGNYQRWDDRVASLDDFPNVAVVGAPIHWGLADPGGEIKGILFVADDVSRVFSQADADLLSLFAIQAAIAIENAQLYEQAQQDAKTKAVLLRQVNHRVRNNLTALIGLLTIERYRAEAEGLLDYQSLLNNLGNRIHGLASVHSMLSESEWTPLSLYKLVVQIARLSSQSLPRGKHVSIEVAHSPVRVTPDQAHNLAVVINELATNTVKYALREQDMVNIDVRIEFDGDIITLIFRNDGPDYPPEVLRMERIGTGLELLQNIVRQSLRGELLLRNDGGAVTEIRFKVRAT